jgi:hypothetical protein
MCSACRTGLPANSISGLPTGVRPLTYFDLDMTTPLTFPRMVATLPSSWSWWWGGGQNGLWVADNQCVGDSCRLTAMVAQEYRRVCTDGGGDVGFGDCAQERPFLEVYGACPSGTQSGDNILPWWFGEATQSPPSRGPPATRLPRGRPASSAMT